jgi:transcriptional regulator with XRE-family HTH domain
VAEPALRFAGLLRQLRTEARLTQEELAGAAGLSPRSVSDLERGINRTARRDTALLLADALSLAGQVRVLFVAAALAGNFPDGQFFLPLHAHTPGQRPVDPADALASLLLTAGVAAQHIPPGLRRRSRDLAAGRSRDMPAHRGPRRAARPGHAQRPRPGGSPRRAARR